MTTPYTMQTAFDAIVARLYDGTGQALEHDGNDSCTYYDPASGLKCAVGALLPNSAARAAQEQLYTPYRIVQLWPDLFEGTTVGDLDKWGRMLASAQRIHDNGDNWAGLKFTNHALLRNLADEHNLNFNRP